MWHLVSTLPQRTLIGMVRAYRLVLSPWVGGSCRFEPTCSAYALEALQQYGAAAGTYLTLHRLSRCQPFCAGGHDPLPSSSPALFQRLVTGAPHAAGSLTTPSTDKTSP